MFIQDYKGGHRISAFHILHFFRCIFRVGSNNGYPQIFTTSIGVLPDYVTWSENRPYLKHISKAPIQRHPRSLC